MANRGAGGRPKRQIPFAEIFDRVGRGELVTDVCRGLGIPVGTFFRRVWQEPRLHAAYAEARGLQAHAFADEAVRVALDAGADARIEWKDGEPRAVFDGPHVQRARLIVDTLKWRCAKQLPQVYGEKVTLEGSEANPVRVAHAIELDEIAGRLSREEREVIMQLIERREQRKTRRRALEDRTIEGSAGEVPDEE